MIFVILYGRDLNVGEVYALATTMVQVQKYVYELMGRVIHDLLTSAHPDADSIMGDVTITLDAYHDINNDVDLPLCKLELGDESVVIHVEIYEPNAHAEYISPF